MSSQDAATKDLHSEAPSTSVAKPFQFSLRQLFWLMGVVSLFGSGYYWLGMHFLEYVLGLSCLALPLAVAYLFFKRRPLDAIVVATVLFVLIALALPSSQHKHSGSYRHTCSNHLKQIGIALHNYHDVYGSFPPAYIADANGKPMHSWRVLILPFMEQKVLYDSYNFNEAWDGPNNRKLHDVVISPYRCPSSHDKQPSWETSYVAIVGPETMWPGEKATRMSDLQDGTSNTLMVTEALGSGIHWMEPRDLHVVQSPLIVNPKRGTGISSSHPNAVVAVFADGHTQALTNNTPAEIIRALLTIDGGEQISDFD